MACNECKTFCRLTLDMIKKTGWSPGHFRTKPRVCPAGTLLMTDRAHETMALRGPMGLTDWALLVILSVLWGGSFLFIKIAVADMPPLVLVLGRVGLAALTLAMVIRLSGQKLPRGIPSWRAFFAMGLVNNIIPFSLIFWGQQFVAAGVGAILNASTPFFAVIAAHMLTEEEASIGKIVGVAVGFAGVMTLIGPGVLWHNENPWPMLAFLGAAFSYGFSGVYARRFQSLGITPLQTAFGQLSASTVIMLPLALIVHGAFWSIPYSSNTWLSLVLLAVFSTALAYMIFFRILSSAGPTNLSLVTMLIPVSAVLLGAAVLGEIVQMRHILGMVIVALGLLVIDGRLWRRMRAP